MKIKKNTPFKRIILIVEPYLLTDKRDSRKTEGLKSWDWKEVCAERHENRLVENPAVKTSERPFSLMDTSTDRAILAAAMMICFFNNKKE